MDSGNSVRFRAADPSTGTEGLIVSARLAGLAGAADELHRLVLRLHSYARDNGHPELHASAGRVLDELVEHFGLPRPDVLSPAEERVASRAAEGRSNREISEELFVTVKTVEFHLSKVFRKLGITRRSELARSLAQLPADPAAR